MANNKCPFCSLDCESAGSATRDTDIFKCRNCGEFELARTVQVQSFENDVKKATLSFAIWRMQGGQDRLLLSTFEIENILKTTVLPRPMEQVDLLVQYVGDSTNLPGSTHKFNIDEIRARVGAASSEGVKWLWRTAMDEGYVEGEPVNWVRLTLKGWHRYEQLDKEAVGSRQAFMAMQFGKDDVNAVFDVFQAAVDQTGFQLWKLSDRPEAGLIDSRMIVAIRTSRFVVADLSYHNRGAYWEAGFAEGLGRPVIYTCRKEDWDDVHFDTNHYQAVIWDPDELEAAAEELKETIRITLHGEAKMEDG